MNRTPPASRAATSAEESKLEHTSVEGGDEKEESSSKRRRKFNISPSEMKVKRRKSTVFGSPKGGIPDSRKRIVDVLDVGDILEKAEWINREITSIKRMMDSSRNIKTDITIKAAALLEATDLMVEMVEDIESRLEPVSTAVTGKKMDRGMQTDSPGGNSLTCKIRGVLERVEGFGPLVDILEEVWPVECFKNVKSISEEITVTPGCDTLVVIPEGGGSPEWSKKWRNRFPDWDELEESLVPNNEIEFLRMSTETTSRDGSKKVRVQSIYVAICKGCQGDKVEWKELCSLLRGMKALATEHGVRELLVSMAKGMNTEWARKIAQYVFNGTDIVLHMSGGHQNNKREVRKKKEEEVLIVKATDGRNYSQIVRGLTSKIDTAKVGVNVRSVKQTQSGDLLLRIEGGRGAANALKEEIRGKDENMQVTIRVNRSVLFVTDIVAETESEELRSVLAVEMGEPGINVASLRPTRDGNLVATVEVSPQTTKTWISRGRVKVGWVSCRVRGKPELKRCYRCLEFGHTRKPMPRCSVLWAL